MVSRSDDVSEKFRRLFWGVCTSLAPQLAGQRAKSLGETCQIPSLAPISHTHLAIDARQEDPKQPEVVGHTTQHRDRALGNNPIDRDRASSYDQSMSHLLYLDSVDWTRVEAGFGHASAEAIKAVQKRLGKLEWLQRVIDPTLTKESALDLVARTLTAGPSYESLSAARANYIDYVVVVAMRTKAMGLQRKPESNGVGSQEWLAELLPHFRTPRAKALHTILLRGRRFRGNAAPSSDWVYFLLSPAEVELALKLVVKVTEEIDDEDLAEEFVGPFASAAKKGRGMYGTWG